MDDNGWHHELDARNTATFDQMLNLVRDTASLIIILLLLFCIFYLKRASRHLKWISSMKEDVIRARTQATLGCIEQSGGVALKRVEGLCKCGCKRLK